MTRKRVCIVLALTLLQSCATVVQSSARSSGRECSRSVGLIVTDLVIATGFGAVAATGINDSPQPQYVLAAEIAAGVFVASAAYGIFKRHRCGVYREEHPPPVVCGGGTRNIGNRCYCADGMNWNGLNCQGTPSPGNCGGGSYPFGPPNANMCFCLDGFRSENGQCVELQCTGGAIAQVDQCVCPNGQQWDGSQCVAPPEPEQQDQGDQADQGSPCPEGSVVGGAFGDQCMSCPGGMIPTGLYNQECACPDGTMSNGAECVVPQAGAPPPRSPAPTPRQRPARRHNARVNQPPPQQQQTGVTPAPQQPRPQQPAAPQQPSAPPPPPRQAPPPNPAYHASYQRYASEPQNQCRAFTNEPTTNMGACSSFCTGLLQKKLRCQCAPGGC